MGDYICGHAVCNVDVCLLRFAKAFCHAGEADIQKYVLEQNIFTGIVLYTIIITVGWTLIQRRLVRRPIFRYRSRTILSQIRLIRKMLMSFLLHYPSYNPNYIFRRYTDKVQAM